MIVVADTSILLNLAVLAHGELLRSLFASVCIPAEVAAEFETAAARLPCFAGLRLPPWIEVRTRHTAIPQLRTNSRLDPGELAALELAVEIAADAVLVDEAAGRAAAIGLGLATFGILGILLRAKEAGFILAVSPLLDQLVQEANFFVSPAERARCLILAGENPEA